MENSELSHTRWSVEYEHLSAGISSNGINLYYGQVTKEYLCYKIVVTVLLHLFTVFGFSSIVLIINEPINYGS